MPNKIIIPAGYMGSGSSAVTDLISEFDGFDVANGSYEYVFLHCPDGVFDLEDKLLRGNNAMRSDEAIHRFLKYMERLYEPGYWFSNYREKLSPGFMSYCREFITALGASEVTDVHWYFQENVDTPAKRAQRLVRYAIARITGNKRPGGRPVMPLDYQIMTTAFPTPERFYTAARELLQKIYRDLGYDSCHLVLDQLLLPHNLFRLKDYFDENARVIVVDRDPRDVFLLNKYYWMPADVPIPYPTDAAAFCEYYKGVRRSERMIEDPRVMRLYFEDLIYRYDETIGKIYDFLDVDPQQHTARKKTKLCPEVSINNTQIFAKKEAYQKEAEIIREGLSDYLYDFPSDTGPWQETLVF